MGKTSAPPLNGDAIRQARVDGFMTQAEVAERVAVLVAVHGIKFDRSGLSYIESGSVKWPSPKVVWALSQVLGMRPRAMYQTGGSGRGNADGGEDDEAEAAAPQRRSAA